ncbi:hypothetical protein [Lentzea jiangxiensis]|uniref:Uncharacterized protein n=1 Tax=Lentzea jiangxiensis TaxID=641025 RepID=A0A1H0X8R9_9PSEU|nr:hypothetical protein [Lentzea jiangxiensis]SDP99145.1 hypothetical protein SAMN05421507_1523 [Lentzea jiangxiensis]
MNTPITEEDALLRYPELQQLVDVRRAGWIFRVIEDEAHRLTGLAASMSRKQYTDALFIFDSTNVSGVRLLADEYGGGCVWRKSGADLQEVVADLLGLPEPDESGAPTLVTKLRLLWTP